MVDARKRKHTKTILWGHKFREPNEAWGMRKASREGAAETWRMNMSYSGKRVFVCIMGRVDVAGLEEDMASENTEDRRWEEVYCPISMSGMLETRQGVIRDEDKELNRDQII